MFLDLLVIASLVIWLVPLVASGHLSAGAAGVALVVAIALVRVTRQAARGALRVALPIAAVVVMVIVQGRGQSSEMFSFAVTLAPLLLAVVGLYVVLGGLRGRGSE